MKFLTLHSSLFIYFCTFAPFLAPKPSREGGRGGRHRHVKKAFINALFLAYRNFANSEHTAMNIAAVDCSGVCLYPHCIYALSRCIDTFEAYIYVSAWGFLSLLVQIVWAMRRPLYAGRVTVRSSPLFLCMWKERRYHKTMFGWGELRTKLFYSKND